MKKSNLLEEKMKQWMEANNQTYKVYGAYYQNFSLGEPRGWFFNVVTLNGAEVWDNSLYAGRNYEEVIGNFDELMQKLMDVIKGNIRESITMALKYEAYRRKMSSDDRD